MDGTDSDRGLVIVPAGDAEALREALRAALPTGTGAVSVA